MTYTCWYIVKQNWQQTTARAPSYAGLGGNVWPLDDAVNSKASEVHSRTLRLREYVSVCGGEELLCTDASAAEEYFNIASTLMRNLWLLRVSTAAHSCCATMGFDIGFPQGGFSLIETEILVQALATSELNSSSLFATVNDAKTYVEARKSNDALEQLDGVSIVSIEILRQN